MKKLSYFILLLLTSTTYSQTKDLVGKKDKLIYLDSTCNETSKKKHHFFRIIKDYYLDKDSYVVYDYFKSGVLQMEGISKLKERMLKHGDFIFYYPNGNKKQTLTYLFAKKIGKTKTWYDNGNSKEEGEYIFNDEMPEKDYKLIQFWDESNNHLIVNGNGSYSSIKFGRYFETGNYKDGFKDGIFKGEHTTDNSSFVEEYKNGKFISGTRTFSDNTTSKYFSLKKSPSPKNGMKDFYSFIANNFRYPKELKKYQPNGKIVINFVVDNDGKIVDPEIKEGIDYQYDDEAIRVLLMYGDWIPGEQRGQKERCMFSLPIVIQLPN
jgi:antitoxin component YwqK of YwqJK toxin-antitoxin module